MRDARAATVRDAVLAHTGVGSEASASVAGFEALSSVDQNDLIDFLRAQLILNKVGEGSP